MPSALAQPDAVRPGCESSVRTALQDTFPHLHTSPVSWIQCVLFPCFYACLSFCKCKLHLHFSLSLTIPHHSWIRQLFGLLLGLSRRGGTHRSGYLQVSRLHETFRLQLSQVVYRSILNETKSPIRCSPKCKIPEAEVGAESTSKKQKKQRDGAMPRTICPKHIVGPTSDTSY
jgi:hypothetical protein